MNRILMTVATVLGAGSIALGQATTMPAVGPAVQPQMVKVLIVPFGQIGGTGGHEWVGAAIQESLMTEAAGDAIVRAAGLDKPVAGADIAGAVRDAGANIVVFGNFQYAGDQLRITGEVQNVSDGRVLTTLKATGALTDLFKLEDTLSGQLQSALPVAPENAPVVTYGPQQATVPYYTSSDLVTQPAPQPTYVEQPPVYSPPATTYVYSYGYPSYGYPYYYYGGFPIIIGGRFGFHDHDGDRFGRGFVGSGFQLGFHEGFHGGFNGGFRGGFVGRGGFAGRGGVGGHR